MAPFESIHENFDQIIHTLFSVLISFVHHPRSMRKQRKWCWALWEVPFEIVNKEFVNTIDSLAWESVASIKHAAWWSGIFKLKHWYLPKSWIISYTWEKQKKIMRWSIKTLEYIFPGGGTRTKYLPNVRPLGSFSHMSYNCFENATVKRSAFTFHHENFYMHYINNINKWTEKKFEKFLL